MPKNYLTSNAVGLLLFIVAANTPLSAEVLDSAADGFVVQITADTRLDAKSAFDAIVHDVPKWYDGDHSYSGDAANLSIDLQKGCLLETLPEGGFVRHLEVVFFSPQTNTLRLTGGLGPLQEMGCGGAMVLSARSNEQGGSTLLLRYVVVGYSKQQLDKIAPAVDQVLNGQITRLKEHCNRRFSR